VDLVALEEMKTDMGPETGEENFRHNKAPGGTKRARVEKKQKKITGTNFGRSVLTRIRPSRLKGRKNL